MSGGLGEEWQPPVTIQASLGAARQHHHAVALQVTIQGSLGGSLPPPLILLSLTLTK